MSNDYNSEKSIRIRFRLREFAIPIVRDGVVLGKKSPIGCEAMRRALRLMHTSEFEHIEFEDDVISDVLVRANILRRVPARMTRLANAKSAESSGVADGS